MANRTNSRPKQLTPKTGMTKSGRRRYDCGGKIKKKQS